MTDEPRIALIGTLDTKGEEIDYVRERLAGLGARPVVIDSGILGEPGTSADVTRQDVAREAGYELEQIQSAGSRGAAVELMVRGSARSASASGSRAACTACSAWAGRKGRYSARPGCRPSPSASRS